MLIKTEVKEEGREVKVEQTEVKGEGREQARVAKDASAPLRLGQHIEAKLEKESAR